MPSASAMFTISTRMVSTASGPALLDLMTLSTASPGPWVTCGPGFSQMQSGAKYSSNERHMVSKSMPHWSKNSTSLEASGEDDCIVDLSVKVDLSVAESADGSGGVGVVEVVGLDEMHHLDELGARSLHDHFAPAHDIGPVADV